MNQTQLAAATGSRLSLAAIYCKPMNDAMAEFGIDTPVRQAAFLAQVGHESGNLRFTTELWGPTPQQRKYEPPSDLARKLGNTQPGDGPRYRGHGLIQITGRENHRRCGIALGVDAEGEPKRLAEAVNACRSAAWFWRDKKLNALADSASFLTLTKRINGGTNGLEARQELWAAAKTALNVA